MNTFPKLPGDSGIEADTTFCEGIAAFQRGDYLDALAYFAAVHEANPDTLAGIHAQMGVILTYEKYGQPDLALARCHAIAEYPDAGVNLWTKQAIASLHRRYPELLKDEGRRTEGEEWRTEDGNENGNKGMEEGRQPVATWQWRNAGRLPSGKSLGKVKLWWFQGLQALTLVAFLYLVYGLLDWLKGTIAQLLEPLPYVYLLPLRYANITMPFLAIMGVLWLVSPWLLDRLFIWVHGLQFQSITSISKQRPELLKVLNQLSQRKRIALPKLGILPTDAPLAISYGHLPRYTRIILSQGLLDQLTADEVAVVCAGEVAHSLRGDMALMTLVITVLQVPYLAYWGLATGADWFVARTQPTAKRLDAQWKATARRGRSTWQRVLTLPYLQAAAVHYAWLTGFYGLGLLSGVSYCVYWVLRLPVLWLARQRLYQSDRLAVELTGNPNGLTRALLKLAIGTAATIQHQGQTPHLLESLDLLIPLGHRSGMTLGSVLSHVPADAMLDWDLLNPYRSWLNVGQAHPLLGDRLLRLATYARIWKLEPELIWAPSPPSKLDWLTLLQRSPLPTLQQGLTYGYGWFLQSAPYLGLPLGLVMGWLFWGVMWALDLLGLRSVGWMVGHQGIWQAIVLASFSLAILLWLNPFFPEITPTNLLGVPTGSADQTVLTQQSSVLLSLMTQPRALPAQSQPVQLHGKLLGRQGSANLFAQDLVLQTEDGLIRVHHWFRFSPLLELWLQPDRPSNAISQPVRITGWLRRGASVWLDLDNLRCTDGMVSYGGVVVWMAIVATIAALLAIYTVFTTV